MKKLLFIFTILVLGFLALPTGVMASSLTFSVPSNIKVGETFEVLVNADTGNQLINSVDIVIDYDEAMISFSGYKSDNAVVKFWIDSPKDSGGTVSLSGIIPGGVSGLYDPSKKGISPVPLVELLFTANVAGSSELSFVKSEILKHDGKGTALLNEPQSSEVVVRASGELGEVGLVDENPPELFTITFVPSSLFGRTPSMIIFGTQDNESGIKEYQVKMGTREWQRAKSPTPVSQSIFTRNVTVRAFDFGGNFTDASISIPGLVSLRVLMVILLILLFSGVLGRKLLKYKS